jgi:hypothetical protein
MTFDEFEAKLSDMNWNSGQRLIVHYDVLAELFLPGSSGRGSELDKTINVEACFTFAREHNCGVDNRFKENELLLEKIEHGKRWRLSTE